MWVKISSSLFDLKKEETKLFYTQKANGIMGIRCEMVQEREISYVEFK